MMYASKSMVRNTLVRAVAPFASLAHGVGPHRRVLALHDVSEHHRDAFVHKMELLKTHYYVVSLEDLFTQRSLADERTSIALTFDDGYKEYATFVAPLFKELGFPATFFINSGLIGLEGSAADKFAKERLRRMSTFDFLSREDVQVLANDALFEIGGHTTNHSDVATLDEQRLQEEIGGDKNTLERLTDTTLRWFAYPFGATANMSDAAATVIREAGYSAAFSIVPSFWTSGQNPYRIGRDSLSVTDSDALWHAWLRGGYDAVSRVKSRLL